MDKQRTKILVKKINSLFSSIEMEDGVLSAIERDLMLKYIRDLYEEFVEEAPTASISKPSTSQPKPAAPEIISTQMEQPRFSSPPKVTPTPAPPTIIEPTATEPTITPTPIPPPPTTTSAPVYVAPTSTPSGNSKVNRLFAFTEAKELSEKLSQQPIRDLPSALSINDKLLYTNELFGRQHNILNDTLQTLNRFDGMDQARNFLISLAEQYEWSNEEREDIARSFIKTIRRRYEK
jgi:hypothetical protein